MSARRRRPDLAAPVASSGSVALGKILHLQPRWQSRPPASTIRVPVVVADTKLVTLLWYCRCSTSRHGRNANIPVARCPEFCILLHGGRCIGEFPLDSFRWSGPARNSSKEEAFLSMPTWGHRPRWPTCRIVSFRGKPQAWKSHSSPGRALYPCLWCELECDRCSTCTDFVLKNTTPSRSMRC